MAKMLLVLCQEMDESLQVLSGHGVGAVLQGDAAAYWRNVSGHLLVVLFVVMVGL